MALRRNKAVPPIKMKFWKREGELYFAEVTDLEEAIRLSGNSEDVLKRRLGAGYADLLDALKGKRIDGWSASHLEWGLTPESEPFSNRSWSPLG